MKELCCGFKNVRGSKNDFKNFSRDLKVYISNADGAMFVQNLEQKVKSIKGGNYFDYCVDESRYLTRVFWADAIGRRDYQLFGDSLSFDSTYDTNKYSLVFCPFTGVDNHKRCVTFCAALLSKEDVESFVWLFQTFLKCMGREPSCIINDQDPTMGIAIQKVFTKTKHELCMWHIMRKAPEKVGTQFCNETEFLKKLGAVVWDREIDPHVFVDCWNSVMEEFDLVDHEWFAYMLKIRHLWIPTYFKDLFMDGLLRSTSRSEGENSFFCNFINPHVTCVEFFVRYETALDAQRHEQDELNRLNKSEPQLLAHLHLGKHAVVVCSRAIFYDFQEECQAACCHVVLKVGVLYMEMVWSFLKDILKKASAINVVLDDASKYDKKKQLVSDVWSKIFSCVSLSEQFEDDLSELIRTLSSFEEQMLTKNNPENATSSKEVKDADIQVLVGSNEVDVNIFPPNQCLNKGSTRSSKLLKSAKEIASEEKSKKGRTCKACGQSGVSHDSVIILKQLVSDVWSKIFSCVSLSEQSKADLSELIRTLSSFEEQMLTKNNHENATSSKEVKDADIQVLVGSNEVEVNIFPPNQCLNKGSAKSSKRLKSAKEIASEEKSKKGRTCRACGQSGVSHDIRNCPNKCYYTFIIILGY
ncbi:protein FAR1-RELATED SEQUENCE 5-like [Chenopodium quinoa]|uniref:protein FAR1-RELATED SEQUENCE 5-like n=1 Tax=Chenopodium quinoa TaxID=63459 RepID=UPI000B76EF8A|nr:protein FAR1-RELATED SEQUENCE 5-like [Chenopodium quinoa]